ncbi:squalene synthase HpnC [Sphingosinicellaceae bacterium]|nr:squalene synthase HpnC [Sphingosinicellaceae bacterium]
MNAPANLPHRTEKSENFPVASRLIAPQFRGPILAFYRFARTADDIADDAGASVEQRLAGLEAMRATLVGDGDCIPAAELRLVLAERGLTPEHPLDLLAAFRRDVSNPRVTDWADLIGYCRLSAMPVGRFVLDVHGEDRATWAASDALCAALQVINHLQDCGEDWRDLDRAYVPADWLAAEGETLAALAEPRSSPGLARVIARMVAATDGLLAEAAGFARMIRDRRLALEVAVIHRLAVSLNDRLRTRDPLVGGVHHGKLEAAGLALGAVAAQLLRPGRLRVLR